ncbi:hypothetical protein [Blastopirellula marina]|uniref:Uncharacterized protein n=1 Tax=Blastopirellula marina TaxID=124 RepID=A0A2S8G9K5_9BACT|nr:hypothetical protein [Blastopirellula marina]PQO41145.1 hypothetical protein C5Y98_04100 [Blastopirellula marina]PTL46021.1 hypothetical protein C5Y97_04100 [Blastopirellula marina]
MSPIQERVLVVRHRQQLQRLWKFASFGLLSSGFAACLLGALRWLTQAEWSWSWVVATLVAGPVLGLIVAFIRQVSLREAAAAIDHVCNLKDRTQTALGFLQASSDGPIHRLQIDDTQKHLANVDPVKVAPISRPKWFPLAVCLGIGAVLLVILPSVKSQVEAASAPNLTVLDSADRVAENLKELKEFQDEHKDPELEKLIQELMQQTEALKEEAADPKEALAKLSEMEASLQEMQAKLEPDMENELAKVGDVLSLSEAMDAAGKAMAQGDMEKAEEELAKLEMPELDRKTEKAITEKLEELKQNSGPNGQKRQQMKEALGQISSGLSQGDRSQFKDGVKGLASECKKQGNRKKLSDLLRKQCQCLGECKSNCEGQCKSSSSSSPKKGGKKAGSASTENAPGDQTPLLHTNPQMNLTGQDSGQGDVDIETEEGTAREQEAVRSYREKAQEYEAMSESVLNSESIPLGHRQTIRRYFQSIRPEGAETDQVLEQSGSPE